MSVESEGDHLFAWLRIKVRFDERLLSGGYLSNVSKTRFGAEMEGRGLSVVCKVDHEATHGTYSVP